MKTGLLLLPSLAAICYSAALPEVRDGDILKVRDTDVTDVANDYTLTVTVTAAKPTPKTTQTLGSVITLTKTVTASKKTTSTTTSKKPTTTAPPVITIYKTLTDILPSTVYVTTTDDGGDDGGDDNGTTTIGGFTISLGGWGPPWWRHFSNSKRQIIEPVTIDEPEAEPTGWFPGYGHHHDVVTTTIDEFVTVTTTDAEHRHHHLETHIPSVVYQEVLDDRAPQTLDFPAPTGVEWPWYPQPTDSADEWVPTLTLGKKSPKSAAPDCQGAAQTTEEAPSHLTPGWSWFRRPAAVDAVTVTVTSYIYKPTGLKNQAPFTQKGQDELDVISRTVIEEAVSSSSLSAASALSTLATSTRARVELRD